MPTCFAAKALDDQSTQDDQGDQAARRSVRAMPTDFATKPLDNLSAQPSSFGDRRPERPR